MKIILNAEQINNILRNLADEIISQAPAGHEIAVIGIRSRGEVLAQRLAAMLSKKLRIDVLSGTLDITLYRDDLSVIAEQPVVHHTDLIFDISGKKVILVDDVLYTGRTVRAALTELIDFGRPQFIQLAVLIDRGFRELPIRPDYVGKNIPTSQKEIVEVKLEESDEIDEVVIMEKNNGEQ